MSDEKVEVQEEQAVAEQPQAKAKTRTLSKADPKKSNSLDYTWLALGVLIGLAVITSVINYVSENKARQLIAEFEARNPVPRIVVMDFDGMIEGWQEDGESPERIARGVALLSKMMREDNYIVLDYAAVVTSGKKFNVRAFALEDIEEMAVSRGMDLEEEVREMMLEAKEQAEQMTQEMLEELRYQLGNQAQVSQYR